MQPIDWLLRPLVERIVRLEANLRRAPVLRWGTVTSMSPLRVQLDADPEPLVGEPSIAAPIASVGQRVLCAIQNRRVTVLGSKQLGPTTFALKSQLDAWGPVDGTHAWVTAENREYVRRGGHWHTVPVVLTGRATLSIPGGTSTGEISVSYDGGYFVDAPEVVLTPVSAMPAVEGTAVRVKSRTSAGFTIEGRAPTARSYAFAWTATLS